MTREAMNPAKYSDVVSDGGLDPRNKFDFRQSTEDRAVELLKRCENEMRYAGWDKFEADNTARNGVYEQVKQYLEKNT